jgi:adenylosuccinate lyase
MKEEGADADLLERIAVDDAFGLTSEELADMVDPMRFVGRAPEQVARFLTRDVAPVLKEQNEHIVNLDTPEIHV